MPAETPAQPPRQQLAALADELERLHAEATPAPWEPRATEHSEKANFRHGIEWAVSQPGDDGWEVAWTTAEKDEADARLIALLRNNVPAIADALRAADAAPTPGSAQAGDPLESDAVGMELRKWQDAIREKVIKCSGAPPSAIDGGGCDSGNPLDLSLSEIGQAFAYIQDATALGGGGREEGR